MKELTNNLNKAIHDYIELFEKKHELEFEYWVADRVGEVAVFGYYFLGFCDIRIDLEQDIEKSIFFEWYSYALDLAMEGKPVINYESYLKINKPLDNENI